jgi:hypothetical protein
MKSIYSYFMHDKELMFTYNLYIGAVSLNGLHLEKRKMVVNCCNDADCWQFRRL